MGKAITERVEKLEKRVDEILVRLDKLVNQNIPPEHNENKPAKKESAREFFFKFNPKSDTDKTLVAINFLEKKGIRVVSTLEIADAYKEMREKPPKNIADKIQMLDKRGFLISAGKEGKRNCWSISSSGEDYLHGLEEAIKNEGISKIGK